MRKYSLVFVLFFVLTLLGTPVLMAQNEQVDEENPISISCDLMSRYVWRGTDFGSSPSIQPGIEYSKSGFAIGAWGAFSVIGPGTQEADIYASYTFNDLITLTVTDYFFPNELADYKYFDFGKTTTGHVLETSLSYNGTEKLPLSALIAINVFGADAKRINDDGTTGNIQYSSYLEASYAFKHFDLFIGANLTNVDEDKGEAGYYGSSIGVVNLGLTTTKEIEITNKFKLPLTVSLITNPQAEKIYLVAGFTF